MMIGASPPSPKCEISVTAAAKMAATPASTALPPAVMRRAPASTVNVRPAATTPCDARTSPRTDLCCWPESVVDSRRIATVEHGRMEEYRITKCILLQPAHRQRAKERPRREKQERPAPARHGADRRHEAHAHHRQQEAGAGLQGERRPHVCARGVVGDQSGELFGFRADRECLY